MYRFSDMSTESDLCLCSSRMSHNERAIPDHQNSCLLMVYTFTFHVAPPQLTVSRELPETEQ